MTKNDITIPTIFGAAAITASLFHHYPLMLMALVQLVLSVLFIAGRTWSLRRAQAYEASAPTVRREHKPFFSIQIATYSEPPELVIKTLESLKGLKGAGYEAIVVDNNPPAPELYEPVQEYCRRNGFRFFHFDDVEGAKAGALNLILPERDPRTTHVLVLDADYQAESDLLIQAARYASRDYSLIQFPQSYRNSAVDCPLSHEYASFFDVYMTAADEAESVLSTGTAAVVRVSDLQEVGGWPTTTITEDADLGLLLKQHGKSTTYVHRPVAEGVMPTATGEFLKQRSRWIKGNIQVLLKHSLSNLPLQGRVAAFLQLTAWATPLVLYPLILLLGTVRLLLGTSPSEVLPALALSQASFAVYYLFVTYFFIKSDEERPLRTRLQAALLHLGTYWTSLQAVLEGLSGRDLAFERTSKEGEKPCSDVWKMALPVAALLAVALLCGEFLHPVVGIGWCLLSGPSLGRLYMDQMFCHIHERSEH